MSLYAELSAVYDDMKYALINIGTLTEYDVYMWLQTFGLDVNCHCDFDQMNSYDLIAYH